MCEWNAPFSSGGISSLHPERVTNLRPRLGQVWARDVDANFVPLRSIGVAQLNNTTGILTN